MKEIDLGVFGREYLTNCLRQERGMAAALNELVQRGGRCSAVVPDRVTVERARKLEVGGLMSLSDSVAWLSARVRALPDGLIVFQDVWAKPDDSRSADAVVVGDCIYYCRRSTTDGLSQILTAITSYLWVAMYLRFNATPLVPIAVLRERPLEQLVQAIEEAYVSALIRKASSS